MTPEQLGLNQANPSVLRLPDGLEAVGDGWFRGAGIEQLAIPNCVRKLGNFAFSGCEGLRELVFEPGSRLKSIGEHCFSHCALERVELPRSVRTIGDSAFRDCGRLCALSFEEGSRLTRVGHCAFACTRLRPESVAYPAGLKAEGHGSEW